KLNKRLIPLMHQDVEEAATPENIARLNYIFARKEDNFDHALDQLLQTLETNIEWVREHTRLGELAQRWQQQSQPVALTLRGEELNAAEHWIAEQPSKAPPPTSLHRSFISQSRLAASKRQRYWLIGAITVAVLAGTLAVWAEFNRRQAVAERERVERVLIKTTQATKDLVVNIAGEYATRQGVPRSLIIDILFQSRKLVDELAGIEESRPELLMNGGFALAELSDALRLQGEQQAALETALASVRVFQQLGKAGAVEEASQIALILAYDRLGDAQLQAQQTPHAMQSFKQGLDIVKTLPTSDLQQRHLAIANENIANVLSIQGALEKALALHLEVLATRRQQILIEPDSAIAQRELAVSLENVGDLHIAQESPEQSIRAYRESLALAQKLADSNPTNTQWQQDLATANHKLGNALMALDEPSLALRFYRADQAISKQLLASDSEWIDWQQALMVSHERVGNASYRAGKAEDSLVAFSAALDLAKIIIENEQQPPAWLANLAKLFQQVSLISQELGQGEQALAVAEEAVTRIAQADSNSQLLPDLHNNVAWFALFQRQYQQALAAAESAIAKAPETLLYAVNRAHALMFLGETELAAQAYRQPLASLANRVNWIAMIRADFVALRKAGLSHRLMLEIEQELNSYE
ncbi:MAG: tetratricopeptide repeat protein, partial [Gammaproteobacteria bacterium]|nr:tetratricopeptide repeat protein [Gammaproteobacteria bacterium]